MKKIKEIWDKTKYWQKAFIIGLVINIFLSIVLSMNFFRILDFSSILTPIISLAYFIPAIFYKNICGNIAMCFEVHIPLWFGLTSLTISVLFISIINGVLIEFINRQYNLKKIKKSILFLIMGIVTSFFYLIILSFDYYEVILIIGNIDRYTVIFGIPLIAAITCFVAGFIFDFLKEKKWLNLIGWSIYILFLLIITVISVHMIGIITLFWTGYMIG